MDRRYFLRNALQTGLLVTAHPAAAFGDGSGESGSRSAPEAYADFFALPIYRCYVRGLQYRDVPAGFLDGLTAPQPLDLMKEPTNPHDRRAIAVYASGVKVGYLPREDNLILEKLIRRGLPVACRLVGVQPEEESYRQLSVEVALLYPSHATTDRDIISAERARREGLQRVGRRGAHRLHTSGDPLSAGHVYAGYYEGNDDEQTREGQRRGFLG